MNRRQFKVWNVYLLFVTFSCLIGASHASAAGLAGTYTGTYSGSSSGTVTITIDTFGNAFCRLADKAGSINTWGSGAAISNGEGPNAQSFATCATRIALCQMQGTCYGPIQPAFDLGLSGSFQAGSTAQTTTIEGNWFTSNGGSGIFSAAYTAGIDATSPVNPAALSGLWYDPKYSGSGFSFTGSSAGLLVSYFGWDKSGNRLWLTSSLGPTQVTIGQSISLDLTETRAGAFVAPASPKTAVSWGTLTLIFTSCTAATATLSGADGDVSESLVLLAGLNGWSCQ